MKPIFSADFREILRYHNMKIRPMGTDLFHTDWQTDITKLTVAIRNSENAPKNCAYNKYSKLFIPETGIRPSKRK
jgi:hypothetical protein